MDSNTLSDFRVALYGSFLKSGDALMNLADPLLTESTAQSVVELSLSPCFQRKWHSLYKGIKQADVDRKGLRSSKRCHLLLHSSFAYHKYLVCTLIVFPNSQCFSTR